MHLGSLALTEFRSVRSLVLEIPEGGFGLIGANAAGKSTIFEAIVMLATTRSTRAGSERELINWSSGEDLMVPPYARIEGTLSTRRGTHSVSIGLQAEQLRAHRVRKVITLDDKRTTARRAVGVLKCVMFEPADIDLVSGSPGQRRRFLDVLLSQIDPAYLSSLSRYNRIVEQRNSLIKSLVREGQSWSSPGVRTQLDYWDEELVAHGSRIAFSRLQAVDHLDVFARDRLASFTGSSDMITRYQPATGSDDHQRSRADRLLSAGTRSEQEVAFELAELLKQLRNIEFRRGMTLIGPHRDDLNVTVGSIDVGTFGSRGQQRLAAIALKLAEADLMNRHAGEQTVVLLDDVYSELDRYHRQLLSQAIGDLGAQVIVSATDRETLGDTGLAHLPVATMSSGSLTWTDSGEQRPAGVP
ncbi:MAG: DNA replication/repair protein RecF [Thermomicrobiales bacterium]